MHPKLLIILLIVIPFFLIAQANTGKVIDSSKLPVAGAYVIHLQSEHHAHTNEMGVFILNHVHAGDTLQIMHLGYETKLVPVTDPTQNLTVQLTEAIFTLDDIVVGQNLKTINLIADIDTKTNPVNSSQEVLRKVPGLFIGQHAGGGKAEQIFLRGFDIDHGTDVGITVDGLPVNMVSHAHGQGYADLHFVIPELIDYVDFGKGPYFADKGNFTTAGYVALKTKDKLENSAMSVEFGRFNTQRLVGTLKLLDLEKHHAYVASEYVVTDGPFESSQNFKRTNFFAKYTGQLSSQDKVSVLTSHFYSRWDASGQIPQRAVDSGLISRFGSIDDTEGGNTSRTNLAMSFTRNINSNTFVKSRMYYSLYDFELFSNFTFFLEDSINQDQIVQREKRQIYGVESEWNHSLSNEKFSTFIQGGIGLRYDDINGNELSHTKNRKTTLENIRLGDVNEANLYLYTNVELDFNRWLIQGGVRVDHFNFNYLDQLDSIYQPQYLKKPTVSPKLSFIFNARDNLQLFCKSGMGFHSNDSRVVLDQTSDAIIPAAYGLDFGGIFKPTSRLIINTALWYLYLEQEFVYVGDAGIVEPSGETRRVGVDLGFRMQFSEELFANTDLTYALARSINEPEDSDYIPLAPLFTATGGLQFKKANFSTGLNYRYMHDRPADETNSIIAESYFIVDWNASYEWKKLRLGFSIENLFNQEWKETQFATESRLAFETESVNEIHFTPGTPFFIKGLFQYKF